jgi:hypothetical protein
VTWLLAFIPSRAKLWAALSAAGALAILAIGYLIRRDAARDARMNDTLEDYEHALDIHRRVGAVGPDELRQYDGAGYRD